VFTFMLRQLDFPPPKISRFAVNPFPDDHQLQELAVLQGDANVSGLRCSSTRFGLNVQTHLLGTACLCRLFRPLQGKLAGKVVQFLDRAIGESHQNRVCGIDRSLNQQLSSRVGFAEREIIIAGMLNLLQALPEFFNASI
jgi:hypothetical protein